MAQELFDSIRIGGASATTVTSNLANGPTVAWMVFPLFAEEEFDGILAASYRPQRLLASQARPESMLSVELRELDRAIARAGPEPASNVEPVVVSVRGAGSGAPWNLSGVPSNALVDANSSGLPSLVLVTFAAFGVVLGASVREHRASTTARLQAAKLTEDSLQLNQRLTESEQRLQLALDNSHHGLWDWNIGTGDVYFDHNWRAILGFGFDEMPNRLESWTDGLHPDDVTRINAALQAHLASDDAAYDVDYRARTKDGSWCWVNTKGHVVARDLTGRPLRMVGTIHDIGARKAADELVRASLREKETLLREIHHRVKNNLAMISSMLYLQSTRVHDPAIVALLNESQQRVHSMALVHETLYRSRTLAAVDFAVYLKGLVQHLKASFNIDKPVTFTIEAGDVSLVLDQAVPCGLIVSELVGNAMKHAFRSEARPEVIVTCSKVGSRCCVTVADNGTGLSFEQNEGTGLGLQLVRTLTEQLGGVPAFSRAGTPPNPLACVMAPSA